VAGSKHGQATEDGGGSIREPREMHQCRCVQLQLCTGGDAQQGGREWHQISIDSECELKHSQQGGVATAEVKESAS